MTDTPRAPRKRSPKAASDKNELRELADQGFRRHGLVPDDLIAPNWALTIVSTPIPLSGEARRAIHAAIMAAQERGKLPTPLRTTLVHDTEEEVLESAFLNIEEALGIYCAPQQSSTRARLAREVDEFSDRLWRLQTALEDVREKFGEIGEGLSERFTASMAWASEAKLDLLGQEYLFRLSTDPWLVTMWTDAKPPIAHFLDWVRRLRLPVELSRAALHQRGREAGGKIETLLLRLGGIWFQEFAGEEESFRPTMTPTRAGGDGGPFLAFVVACLQALNESERPRLDALEGTVERYCRRLSLGYQLTRKMAP